MKFEQRVFLFFFIFAQNALLISDNKSYVLAYLTCALESLVNMEENASGIQPDFHKKTITNIGNTGVMSSKDIPKEWIVGSVRFIEEYVKKHHFKFSLPLNPSQINALPGTVENALLKIKESSSGEQQIKQMNQLAPTIDSIRNKFDQIVEKIEKYREHPLQNVNVSNLPIFIGNQRSWQISEKIFFRLLNSIILNKDIVVRKAYEIENISYPDHIKDQAELNVFTGSSNNRLYKKISEFLSDFKIQPSTDLSQAMHHFNVLYKNLYDIYKQFAILFDTDQKILVPGKTDFSDLAIEALNKIEKNIYLTGSDGQYAYTLPNLIKNTFSDDVKISDAIRAKMRERVRAFATSDAVRLYILSNGPLNNLLVSLDEAYEKFKNKIEKESKYQYTPTEIETFIFEYALSEYDRYKEAFYEEFFKKIFQKVPELESKYKKIIESVKSIRKNKFPILYKVLDSYSYNPKLQMLRRILATLNKDDVDRAKKLFVETIVSQDYLKIMIEKAKRNVIDVINSEPIFKSVFLDGQDLQTKLVNEINDKYEETIKGWNTQSMVASYLTAITNLEGKGASGSLRETLLERLKRQRDAITGGEDEKKFEEEEERDWSED